MSKLLPRPFRVAAHAWRFTRESNFCARIAFVFRNRHLMF
jgi:hypothetical protein